MCLITALGHGPVLKLIHPVGFNLQVQPAQAVDQSLLRDHTVASMPDQIVFPAIGNLVDLFQGILIQDSDDVLTGNSVVSEGICNKVHVVWVERFNGQFTGFARSTFAAQTRITVNTLYHLSTCNTCQRIIKELNLPDDVQLVDIKENPPSAALVDAMAARAGSYEALFNRRSQQYRKQGLHEQDLSEADYKRIIPTHYTFIKRPILDYNGKLFVGNAKKTVAAMHEAVGNE